MLTEFLAKFGNDTRIFDGENNVNSTKIKIFLIMVG